MRRAPDSLMAEMAYAEDGQAARGGWVARWMDRLWPAHWQRPSTLQVALAISVGLHLALLTLRFADPERFNRLFEDTPLEVVLVNAHSDKAPAEAKAIAQANLAGGGEAAHGLATSPLPPTERNQAGDAAVDSRAAQIEQLQREQMQLLAVVKQQLALLPPPDPNQPLDTPEKIATEAKRQNMLRMLAAIEKRIQEENARPRKRYVSPATREAAYAGYYDQLRQRIEARGTRDFPQESGKRLYGELTLQFTIDAKGQLVEARVMLPSNSKALDGRALAIVRAAGPYGAFTPEMRRSADQIVVTSRFRFTREDGLQTQLLSQPQ